MSDDRDDEHAMSETTTINQFKSGDRVTRPRDGARGTVIDATLPFVVHGPTGVCPLAVNFDGEWLTSWMHPDEVAIDE